MRGVQIPPLSPIARPMSLDFSTRDSGIARMTGAISVRLPEDIATRLEDLTKSLERPKSVLELAVEDGLELLFSY